MGIKILKLYSFILIFNLNLFGQKIVSDLNILCIPDSLININNVLPGDDISKVITIFGEPIDKTDEIDFPTLFYNDINFNFCYNTLALMELHGVNIKTKLGLHVGLTKNQVIDKIRINPDSISNDDIKKYFSNDLVISIGGCDSLLLSGMQLEFDENEILKKILIGYDCP